MGTALQLTFGDSFFAGNTKDDASFYQLPHILTHSKGNRSPSDTCTRMLCLQVLPVNSAALQSIFINLFKRSFTPSLTDHRCNGERC